MKNLLSVCLVLGLVLSASADHSSPESSHSRADDHAPIGVTGDHRHQEGEWMASYRYRYMNMQGNLNSKDSVSTRQVLQNFMVSPTRMTLQGHMLGLMHAPNDRLTLSLMASFMDKSMDHVTRSGRQFTTQASGIGDLQVAGLMKLWEEPGHTLHLNAGLSLPTGSIDVKDLTPMGPNSLLPYPMQLGSGTIDLKPGLTYRGQSPKWSWGSQALGTLRLGSNKRGYRLGNVGELSVWGARNWTPKFSSSLRLHGQAWGDIAGRDLRLNPRVVPTADPELRGGKRLDILLGLNGNFGNGHRLAVEAGVPIVQSLDGPQLKTEFVVTGGWQYSF